MCCYANALTGPAACNEMPLDGPARSTVDGPRAAAAALAGVEIVLDDDGSLIRRLRGQRWFVILDDVPAAVWTA